MNSWPYSTRSSLIAAIAIAASVVTCSGCQKVKTKPESADSTLGSNSIENDGLTVTVPGGARDSVKIESADDSFDQSAKLSDTSREWMKFGETSHRVSASGGKNTPKRPLSFSTAAGKAPSDDHIPVLHTITDSGYQMIPATYYPKTKNVVATATDVSLVNFGWFNPQGFTKTVDSYAQKIIDDAAKKPKCVKDAKNKKSKDKAKLLWLCSLDGGDAAGLEAFSRSLVPVAIQVDKNATVTEGSDAESDDVADFLVDSWSQKAKADKGTILPSGDSLKVTWPEEQETGSALKAEAIATWLLTSSLLKTLLAVGPVEKDSKTVARLQKINMAECFANQAKSLSTQGIVSADDDQKKTILNSVVSCFEPIAATLGKTNPTVGSIWSVVTANPDVLPNAMSLAWTSAASNDSARYKASVAQVSGSALDEKYAAGAKRLRLQMGGRIVDTANGSTMPENGTKAVAWLTKILGKPSSSKGTCPSAAAKYYAWNNFRITVLTKDIDYEPEPFRAGTVGGWQVSLKPQQGQKTIGFRVVGENNKASKYITTGSTMVDALNLYPGATLEPQGKQLTIDYFAGDITNISISGQPGKTTPTAPVETMAAGVGATCGADSNHKGW